MGSSWISLPRLSATLLAAALAVIGVDTAAQDLEPRTYSNAPVGLNFFIAGYGYTSGGVATDPTLPLENANVEASSIVMAYAHALRDKYRNALPSCLHWSKIRLILD